MKKALAKIETLPSADITLLNAIRIETVLSRYPVHRLGKRGNFNIEIRSKDDHSSIIWKVTYNSGYGQPGPLAYKVDTLIVNRRIDEARQEGLSKVVKLGGLREICRELGITEGGDIQQQIKNALHQNASTYITTKQTYTGSNGAEQTFEFGDTRYGVVFTGEELPDGQKADAVYIILHDMFMSLLKAAKTRPLDYDYLKALPPAAQRFYELLSFEMFAAVMYRHRAKLVYSDYCTHAPQTRYFQYKRMNQQMRDIHELHIKAGYIEDVEYRTVTDSEGNLDWEILYTPGPKARADYKTATSSDRAKTISAPSPKAKLLPKKEEIILPVVASRAEEDDPLAQELIKHGLAHQVAVKLATEKPDECRRQLELLPHQNIKGSKPGFLRRAIEEGYGEPAGYKQEKGREAKVVDQKARQEAQKARRATIVEELVQMVGQLYKSHREAYLAAAQFIEESAEHDLKKFKETSPFYKAIAEAYDGQAKPLELLIEYFTKNTCPLPQLAEFINAQKSDQLKQVVRAHFEERGK